MFGLISGLLGLGSSFVKGMFNLKQDQAHIVEESLKVLRNVNATDAQATTATAAALSSILTQGSFLERNWRPVFMVILMGILICSFFGWVPPYLNQEMSPMMDKIWTMLQIGLGGYLPLRTFEKVVAQLNIGSILKTLIQKKVL